MKTETVKRIGRCWLAAATVLGGGTVLGTCTSRMGGALKTSAKCQVYNTLGVIRFECANPSDFIVAPGLQESVGDVIPFFSF